MTHITCRLIAKNRDQLRDPTLGNRVWATLPFTDLFPVAHSNRKFGARTPRGVFWLGFKAYDMYNYATNLCRDHQLLEICSFKNYYCLQNLEVAIIQTRKYVTLGHVHGAALVDF